MIDSCFFPGEHLRDFHHCFSECFYCSLHFSCHQLVWSQWVFTSFELYPDSFLLHFLKYFVLNYCCCTTSATDMREHFILLGVFYLIHHLEALPQLTFIKVSLAAGSSSLKVAVLPTLAQNTDSAHMFVWFAQCSANTLTRKFI